MYFVTFSINLNDCDRILRVSKFLRENNYLPAMIIFSTEGPNSKLFLGRTFLIDNRFSKFLQHILGQTKRRLLQRKYFANIYCKENILSSDRYYRVIALISVNIVPSWDIEGRELASVRRYPNEGQYSPISVR